MKIAAHHKVPILQFLKDEVQEYKSLSPTGLGATLGALEMVREFGFDPSYNHPSVPCYYGQIKEVNYVLTYIDGIDPSLKEMFDTFNKKYLGGSLPDPVSLLYVNNMRRVLGFCANNQFVFKYRIFILDRMRGDQGELEGVLKHEMAHAIDYVAWWRMRHCNYDQLGHSSTFFLYYLKKMGSKIGHDLPSEEEFRKADQKAALKLLGR